MKDFVQRKEPTVHNPGSCSGQPLGFDGLLSLGSSVKELLFIRVPSSSSSHDVPALVLQSSQQ